MVGIRDFSGKERRYSGQDAGFDDFTKQDAGSAASLVSKMYNENLVFTILDEKRNLQVLCLYR